MNLIIPFETDGSMGKDYGFSGRIIDSSINLPKWIFNKKSELKLILEKKLKMGVQFNN